MSRVINLILALIVSTVMIGQNLDISFDHYAILTKDLEQSSKFYLDVLGLPEVEDKTNLDHIRWFAMGGVELHLIEDKEYQVPDQIGVHFALRVKDLDAFMRRMGRQEIEFKNWFGQVGRTNTRPDGIRQIYFKDPSGYWIEVNGE